MKNPTNEWKQTVGFLVETWRPVGLPDGESLNGYFSRMERLRKDHPLEELFHAFTRSQDEERWTYLPYGPFKNFPSFETWINEFALSEDPFFYLIFSSDSREPLGLSSYTRIDPENGVIEVGHIHFSKGLQKHAAATEAMFLMMKNAFDMGYRRYEWKCDSLNQPSCRAAERLGFSFEGIFRQARIYKGRNRDTIWFSIIDQEWPGLQRVFQQWLAPQNFDEKGRQKISLTQLTLPIIKARTS